VLIDTTFDFRSDSGGRDPDRFSPTLHRYHELLWSRPLPTGRRFELTDARPASYLVHRSDLGEFHLSSDAIIATYRNARGRAVVEQLPESEVEAFAALGCTMGGMIVFPSNRVGGMMTINGHRGFHRAVADRFDLTLECIRRHYLGEPSPLAETLLRYRGFFALFGDFAGYVDHFLLQDLVSEHGTAVKPFLAFDDFTTQAVPRDVATYVEFRDRSMEFIRARNRRIDALAASLQEALRPEPGLSCRHG